jgi:hypothetical protein
MVAVTADRSLSRPRRPDRRVVDMEALMGGVDKVLTEAASLVASGTAPGPDPLLDDFVTAHAVGVGAQDSPVFRRELLHVLEVDRDPRLRRYWRLYGELTGEDVPVGVTHTWLVDALAESVARQR